MWVSGYQMEVTEDVSQNLEKLRRAVREASLHKTDILLTPEGSLSGYTHKFDPRQVQAGLEEITALAAERRVGLALGTCLMEADGLIYNQIRFYTPQGIYLGFHSKILRCGTLTEPVEGEINHFATTGLKTFRFCETFIGGLICNDLWANPACTPMSDTHLTQQLARLGARIIFHAVNGGRDGSEWSAVAWRFHEANLRMRAQAGKVWIVTVDNCTPVDLPCSAPSGVLNAEGNWMCQVEPKGEQFFYHDILV